MIRHINELPVTPTVPESVLDALLVIEPVNTDELVDLGSQPFLEEFLEVDDSTGDILDKWFV